MDHPLSNSFLLIKPHVLDSKLLGHCLTLIETNLTIIHCETLWLRAYHVIELYHHHRDKPYFDRILSAMVLGPVLFIQVQESLEITRPLILDLRTKLPGNSNQANNYFHCPDSEENMYNELETLGMSLK